MRNAFAGLVAACLVLAAGCASNQQPAPAQNDDGRWASQAQKEAEQERTISDLRQKIASLETRIGQGPARVAPSVGAPVSIAIEGPNEGSPGEVAPWRIQVTNHTGATAVDLEVRAQIADGMTVVDNGGSSAEGNWLRWQIPSLPAGQSMTLQFTARADGVGQFVNCVDVMHRIGACDDVRILQPALVCQIGAAEVQGTKVPFVLGMAVTNTGTGIARNVQGDVALSGLRPMGPTQISFGDIPAGQRVERQLQVVGEADGPWEAQLSVQGAPALQTTCGVQGRLVSPNLEITKVGPKMRYQGQQIEYTIRVTSTGSTTAQQTVLVDPLPPGTRFVSAGQGGQLMGSAVQWNLGDLNPGDYREVNLILLGERDGKVVNCAKTRAVNVPEKEACAETAVVYVPAMHINNQDTEDPVPVGGETVYVIEVKNEGQRQTTNVVLTVLIPQEGEYVSAESRVGPGVVNASGQVVFAPHQVMQPGQAEVYRIRVRFRQPGSAVCAGILTFDEFSKPVRAEEGTNIYE